MHPRIVVAAAGTVYVVEPGDELARAVDGFPARVPSCLAFDPRPGGPAWCGAEDGGVFRSDDAGASWVRSGLEGERVTSVAIGPADSNIVWVGTEPTEIWRSEDAGESWTKSPRLHDLPSSSDWSFPPRPQTHHARWIAAHPVDPDRIWVAIEAGALVQTTDGGRTWTDRTPGGPRDTHELAVHGSDPERLRAAAGDGYFESSDGGRTWTSPRTGLEVGYLRSVAVCPADPGTVVVSAATHAHAAYVEGRSDGRLFRRVGSGAWERVREGWPDPPDTIAPLLVADPVDQTLLAADERGVHRSTNGGRSWSKVASYPRRVGHLRGLAVLREGLA